MSPQRWSKAVWMSPQCRYYKYSFNKKDSLIHEVALINLFTYPYRDWWTEHLDNDSLSGLAVEDSGW